MSMFLLVVVVSAGETVAVALDLRVVEVVVVVLAGETVPVAWTLSTASVAVASSEGENRKSWAQLLPVLPNDQTLLEK